MRSTVVRSVMILAGCLVLLYLADWANLRRRITRGTAFQTIQVHQLLATPLKGHKEEFDFMGDVLRSVLTEAWSRL